ncbi:hypothetical protein KFL_003180050 [Klebsormidium nitens]|uniref:Amidase domain-containing protein n=1 Tax=Klebsormidium nitens TaxID=105231 RepID=A0A1Y1I7E6_KLENI|nr:hypothetical protein KFL_003180050 [Klebsormidium nitens]|eukprot:GAQ86884.1 hypothetical protein KFL_003180050 [Klebsormidium nitens]
MSTCATLAVLLATPAFAFPLEKRLQHKEDEQIKRRILLQSTAADATAPIGVPAPSSCSCTSVMYPTTCTIPGTATPYCWPMGYSCFPGSGYACYKQNADGSFPRQPSNFDCNDVVEITIDTIQSKFASGELTSRALVNKNATCSGLLIWTTRTRSRDRTSTIKGPDLAPLLTIRDPRKDPRRRMQHIPCWRSTRTCWRSRTKGTRSARRACPTATSASCTGCPSDSRIISTRTASTRRQGRGTSSVLTTRRPPSGLSTGGPESLAGGRGGQVYCPYVRYMPANVSTSVSNIPYLPGIPTAVPVNETFININSPNIVSGSSGGSAVGTATNVIAVTVGSETVGSVLDPALTNAVVGFRPTGGVMSRNGIVPLSSTQDTAGPLCRTVADCLYMFDAMAFDDLADPVHSGAVPWLPPYTRPEGGYLPYLKSDGLAGKKIAVFRPPFANGSDVYPPGLRFDGTAAEMYAALPDMLRSRGATVDVLDPSFNFLSLRGSVLAQDFKVDINTYLSQLTWDSDTTPLFSLGDLIAYNKKYYDLEFQGGTCCRGDPAYALFYQQSWESAQATGDKRDAAYISAKMNFTLIAQNITDWFTSNGYDAIAAAGNLIGVFARVNFPGISIPCPLGTNAMGVPIGLQFHSYLYKEGYIFSIAYDVEQNLCGNSGRPLPTFCNGQSC